MEELLKSSFEACTAEVMNLFLSTNLTPWEIQFCIGRAPVRLAEIGNRVLICELWHNEDGSFARTVDHLSNLVQGMSNSPWLRIVCECALLCGSLSAVYRREKEKVTVSVPIGDFSAVMSAWYARKIGFPVGDILCCSNDSSSIWELLMQGQLKTGGIAGRAASDSVVPPELERLIYHCGGCRETEHFLECCRRGRIYEPGIEVITGMRRGLHAAVVSGDRIPNAVSGVYRMCGYHMDPNTALAYAGLLDFRNRSQSAGTALILSENSPEQNREETRKESNSGEEVRNGNVCDR